MGKGKLHYIEVFFNEDDGGEDETAHAYGSEQRSDVVEPLHLDITKEMRLKEGVTGVTISKL
jgi:hypothetical protein